ncbi:MAG: cytochrome c3 family protein [Lautropia sp.]
MRTRWLVWLACCLALVFGAGPAAAQSGADAFEHLRTGFRLIGPHANQPCESCHLGGIFKGTPRDCASCHTAGSRFAAGNTVKPMRHVPTIEGCDSCHRPTTFVGGRFRHVGVLPGSCVTCHNGAVSSGKPAGHLATAAACDSCHRSTDTWTAASVDHASFNASTNCAGCHNGSIAAGKPAAHVPVGATNCAACHRTGKWTPSTFAHTQVAVAGQCASCHSGAHPPADGKPARHVPYQAVASLGAANCDTCHKSGFTAWAPARLHANASVAGGCATCHTGGYQGATGKPNTPVHAGATTCETCDKSTATWTSANFTHAAANAVGTGTCDACHDGSTATGKSAGHVPVATGVAKCDSCHRSQTDFRTATTMNHAVVPTTSCRTCHNGSFTSQGSTGALGKPGNHVPESALPGGGALDCNACHKAGFTSWAPARLHVNASVSTGCASCHTGAYLAAVGKPATPVHAGVTVCESCHSSTASWSVASFTHAAANAVGTGTCDTCHNGSTATGKTAAHIPVTTGVARCDSCHRSQTAFATAVTMNHAVVSTTQCKACHNGGYTSQGATGAAGKPANHIPESTLPGGGALDCNACHKAGFTSWAPARLHANVSVSTGCASCHTGGYLAAVGKPATPTHAGVTVCEGCHRSTTSWLTVTFAHSPANAVGTGTCDNCHNGATATGKPPTHIPVPTGVARCDSCHRSQTAFGTAVTMNHGVVTTAQCKSCHNGSYTSQGTTGALAKPPNHIPESQLLNGAAMDCQACHTGTTSWASPRMEHNASQGSGSGWCKGCHVSGSAFLGNMEKKSLTHERKTPVPLDCSQSGCHRPLGNRGTAYRSW